jgi:Tfp pilus assembly protein PilF
MNASIEQMNEGVQLINNGNYSAGEEALKKAASLYEENHQAWYSLGLAHVAQKEWEDASEAFGKAVKVNASDAMYQYHLGHALYETDDIGQAQTHLEQAVKINDRLYKAHYYLGKIYERQDKPKEAAESWTKSAMLMPFFGKPFIALGRLYLKWDMLPQAISVLDQGTLNVKDPPELSDIYYYLGLAFDAKKETDKAIEAYSKAIEVKADNVDAKLQRGFAYADKKDVAKATKDLEDFVQSGGGGNAFNIQAANDRLMRLRVAAATP